MRTTKGAARNKAKKKLFRKARGYRGGRGSCCDRLKKLWSELAHSLFVTDESENATSAGSGLPASARHVANADCDTANSSLV